MRSSTSERMSSPTETPTAASFFVGLAAWPVPQCQHRLLSRREQRFRLRPRNPRAAHSTRRTKDDGTSCCNHYCLLRLFGSWLTMVQSRDSALGWNNPAPSRHRFGAPSTVCSPLRESQSPSCTETGPHGCTGQRKEPAPVAHLRNLRPAHTTWENHLHSVRELQETQVQGMSCHAKFFDCLLIVYSATECDPNATHVRRRTSVACTTLLRMGRRLHNCELTSEDWQKSSMI